MIGSILAFLTAFFTNAGSIIKQIRSIFAPNVSKIEGDIDNNVEQEARDRDQGGRPKWDA